MINLRKDHDFARAQSKGYVNAMQQSIQGHEAARMQLLEQMREERCMATEKIAEVERRNKELEDVLAVKMQVARQSSPGDLYILMPNENSTIPIIDEEQVEGRSNRWFSSLRGGHVNRIHDLEQGLCTPSENAPVNASVDSAHPNTNKHDWGVKSLRAPGVWGGRSKDSVLPK